MIPERKTNFEPTRQEGFSLLVVFLILSVMAAAAMAVLLSTRTDIKVAGHERQHAVAFYAAEAGLAYGKAELLPKWDATNKWTPVLRTTSYRIGVTKDYRFGGNGLPSIRATYTYRFLNNSDDPSGRSDTDSDGRVVIVGIGRVYDSSGTKIVATVTLQNEVEWQVQNTGTGGYQAQPNQDVTGSARKHPDTNAVQMNSSSFL